MNRIKDSKNEEIKEIAKDLDAITKISTLSDSEGGKALIKGLTTDVIACMDSLASGYGVLTLQQMIGISADMKSKLDLIRVLTRADKNKKYLEELLEEALTKEADQTE